MSWLIFAWADPMSKVCLDQHELHPKKFPIGSTFQSAEEVLDDIICDLTSLRDEIRIDSSFQSAQLKHKENYGIRSIRIRTTTTQTEFR
jgi:hypothetical protein